jgi:hypothetical protein
MLASSGWVCPDVGGMTLENYYGNENIDSLYSFGIYYCDDAASMLGYSDPNCETNHTLTNQVMTDATSIVLSKLVTQYFNPSEYHETNIMNYTSQVLYWFKYN